LNFEEFAKEAVSHEQILDKIPDRILIENIEVFKELADK